MRDHPLGKMEPHYVGALIPAQALGPQWAGQTPAWGEGMPLEQLALLKVGTQGGNMVWMLRGVGMVQLSASLWSWPPGLWLALGNQQGAKEGGQERWGPS